MLMKTGHTDEGPKKDVDDFLAHFEKNIIKESGMICMRWGDILHSCAGYPELIKELVEKQIDNSETLYDFPYWRGRDLMFLSTVFCFENGQPDLAERLRKQLDLLKKGASIEEIKMARIIKQPSMIRKAFGFFKLG